MSWSERSDKTCSSATSAQICYSCSNAACSLEVADSATAAAVGMQAAPRKRSCIRGIAVVLRAPAIQWQYQLARRAKLPCDALRVQQLSQLIRARKIRFWINACICQFVERCPNISLEYLVLCPIHGYLSYEKLDTFYTKYIPWSCQDSFCAT